jgi:hypothetical protein
MKRITLTMHESVRLSKEFSSGTGSVCGYRVDGLAAGEIADVVNFGAPGREYWQWSKDGVTDYDRYPTAEDALAALQRYVEAIRN